MRTATTIAVAMLLLAVSTSGCLERYPRPDHSEMEGAVTFQVASAMLAPPGQGNASWDAMWNITKITNSYVDEDDPVDQHWWDEMRIRWSDLQIRPLQSDGPWSPIEDLDDHRATEGLGFCYEDLVDPPDGPDVGDRFWVTSLNGSWADTWFSVQYEGEWYGGTENLANLYVPEDLG